jgi:uncharacterized protein (TIGR02722 family)
MTRTLPALILAMALIALPACSRTVEDIDAGGPEAVKTLGDIDPRDWGRAADEMVQSLLTSGVLEDAPRQPAVLAISRISNRTDQQINVDQLHRRIRASLNQSGKVQTTTVIGLGGRAEDPLAKGEAQRSEFLTEGTPQQTQIARPDYTLAGTIISQRSRDSRATQMTYTFALTLTDSKSGLAVWEDVRDIAKKQNNPGPRVW